VSVLKENGLQVGSQDKIAQNPSVEEIFELFGEYKKRAGAGIFLSKDILSKKIGDLINFLHLFMSIFHFDGF
jgi:hypothetical protein